MAAPPECGNYRDSVESEASTMHCRSTSAEMENGEAAAVSTESTSIEVEAEVDELVTVKEDAELISSAIDDKENVCIENVLSDSQTSHFEQAAEQSPLMDIPETIKVLDDIISEFEDASKPVLMMTTVNGEQQSEDDGYMSLSRKNLPKKDSEELSHLSLDSKTEQFVTLNIANTEVEESSKDCLESQNRKAQKITTETQIVQTTLPKMRTNCTVSKNYSSLPGCGGRSASGHISSKLESSKPRGSSCNGDRNILGIDISAVHNAVLRGGLAKLPEPIVNEHPVTIYPGPSAVRRRPQPIKLSIEKHKEVRHMHNPLSAIISSTSSSSSASSSASSSSSNTSRKTESAAQYSMKETNRCGFKDEYSDDVRSLSPRLHTATAVAWEIHFDSHSKNKSLKHAVRKHVYKNDRKDTTDHIKQSEEAVVAPEITNDYTNSSFNMLGKGTFVIRRGGAKKPPRAINIFKPSPKENGREPTNNGKLDEEAEQIMPVQLPATNYRNVLKPCYNEVIPLLPSPRDKLKLNIEVQHQREVPLLADTNSPEGLIRTAYSSLRHADSTESMCKRSSLEEKELEEELSDNINPQTIITPNTYDNYRHVFQVQVAGGASITANSSSQKSPQEYVEMRSSNTTTPHTDLAPTLEEDEEQYSDFSYGGPVTVPPLKQIESNISALLRGDIAVARVGEPTPHLTAAQQAKRALDFRPGVHKSESGKEMLLSQNAFGPLPPSPPSSSPDVFDYVARMPPLPPSPTEIAAAVTATAAATSVVLMTVPDLPKLPPPAFLKTAAVEVHHLPHTTAARSEERRNRERTARHFTDDLPLPPAPPSFEIPPTVPPHRIGGGHSLNTIKSWSIDSNYKRHKSPKLLSGYGASGSGITTPTGPPPPTYDGAYSTKRYMSYGTRQRNLKQSPREEHRLQTSCSLPETPIFARGSCDIPRTPFRRQNEGTAPSGSRTAPRSSTSHNINLGNSIVGIGGGGTFGTGMCRQRSINHALASNEMLRLSGAPGRGWYPKQRSMRPASTENIDRLATARVWDSAGGMSGSGPSRKPLTLPPNLTASFLNKSPREALRRVTSLLITKKKNTKERRNKPYNENHNTIEANNHNYDELNMCTATNKDTVDTMKNCATSSNQKPKEKKKSLFKNLWKRTKHVSLEQ